MTRAQLALCFMAGGLLGVSAPAEALLESCTVAALPVAFGSYNPTSASPLDSTGTVTVTCTAVLSIAVSYTISLSTGGSGSATARSMAGPTATRLPYNLYTSAARSSIWGDGSGGTSTVNDSYALGLLLVIRNYSVFGRMPAQSIVPSGAYLDTVTVTINY